MSIALIMQMKLHTARSFYENINVYTWYVLFRSRIDKGHESQTVSRFGSGYLTLLMNDTGTLNEAAISNLYMNLKIFDDTLAYLARFDSKIIKADY